ncbi:MAG: putative Ig domain-containing protein [Acidobacteriota bacterium]
MSGQVSCTASAVSSFIRAEGLSERTSDLLVTCTGGTPTPAQQTVPQYTLSLIFNTNVSSRQLAQGWSEALLLVDEPTPDNQQVCATGNGVCSILGTGTGANTYSGDLGRPNVFQGALGSGNALFWPSVPIDPPGVTGQRRFRFTNLRVNASSVTAGGAVQVSISATQFPPIANPTQTVASVQSSFSDVSNSQLESNAGRLSKFSVIFRENFAGVFRTASTAGPFFEDQAQPGGIPLDYETGFYNSKFPNLGARGGLNFAGKADSGTRIRIRMYQVPTSATVTAPLTVSFGSVGIARLVNAAANGSGAYNPAGSGVLPNVSGGNNIGQVTAVYEITQTAANAFEVLEIPFTLTYGNGAPLFQVLNGDVDLAPVNTTGTSDATSPIPRFNNTLPFKVTAPQDPLKITTTTLPGATLGSGYQQIIQASGGTPPYTFTFASPTPTVFPPPGLALTASGTLSGVPNTVGTFRFTVIVRDFDNQSIAATKDFTITVSPNSTSLKSSVSSLDFTAAVSGAPPPAQPIKLSSSAVGSITFTVTVDAGTANSVAPTWIQVTPLSGKTPAFLTVAVNQGDLPAGTYTARIRLFIAGATQPSADIPVTLKVASVPAKLQSSINVLRFRSRVPAPGKQNGFILLYNSGGNGQIRYSSAVLQKSSWITGVTPDTGLAGAKAPIAVRVSIDSAGLAQGIFRDVIRFTSDAGTVDVPVVLRVAPAGPLLSTNKTGIRFSMTEGTFTQAVREIKILNGEPVNTLQWSADIIRGGEWLNLSPASGTATSTTPGILKASIKPAAANLRAGSYYTVIRIVSPGASYSPRYVVAVLNVKASTQSSDIDVDRGGVALIGVVRSGGNPSHVFTLNADSSTAVAFQVGTSTDNGGDWLSVSPIASSVSSAKSETLTVTADTANLTAGVYTGQVTIATADSSQTLSITFVVIDPLSDPVPAPARAAGACSANRMAVANAGLTNSFAVPAGWPATLTVNVYDNCGAAVSNVSVVASFTNGDPPLTLFPDDLTGTYSATWQPVNVQDPMNVTVTAVSADYPQASTTLLGTVKSNAVPTLNRDGTVNNLDPKVGGLLAPGLVAAVYGSGLAGTAESTGIVPLQTDFKGTTVLIGPYQAPLFYVSPGQLNVQLPSELAANTAYPILVIANGAITLPDEIDVVGVQPGVAAFADGRLIAQHANFDLVESAKPAKRGEFLIMYLVGLGNTNPPVVSGAPSPGVAPLGVPASPVTVTLDGDPVEVAFSGLTPFGVGLFQINFKVPTTARLNTPLDVVVKQGGYTANVTQLTVVP